VKKIIDEHGGMLTLSDAPAFDDSERQGALAIICLPIDSAAIALNQETT